VNLAHLRIDEMHTNLDVQSANYAGHKRYPLQEGKSDSVVGGLRLKEQETQRRPDLHGPTTLRRHVRHTP
jgi:hypothetical protein